MKFSTYINGQPVGPYTLEELKSLGLGRSVQVSKEGTEVWQRADEFEELAELWDESSAKKKKIKVVSKLKPTQETPAIIEPLKESTLTKEIEDKRKQKKTANVAAFKKMLIGAVALIALFFLFDKFQKNKIQTSDTENSQKMYEELITEGISAYKSDKSGLAFEKFSAASIIRTENQLKVSEEAQKVYKSIISKNKENANSDLQVIRDVALQSFLIAQQIEDTEEIRKAIKKLN